MKHQIGNQEKDTMASEKTKSYIIITPAKDEEKNISNLIKSIVNQTLKPNLWVIVDDGSTDRTNIILEESQETHDWLITTSFGSGEWDLGIHVYEVYMKGIDLALAYCEEHSIDWNYIGIADGDSIFGNDYFEKIIDKFHENEKLGIASGAMISPFNGKYVMEKKRNDMPWGGGRVWRKECFLDAPYQPVYSGDSVSNIKAKMRGWEIKIFNELEIYQSRKTGSARGLRKGALINGRSYYYRGFTPLFACLKGFKMMMTYPFYPAFWYWYGYFSSLVGKKDRIDDKEIIQYYSKERFLEIKKLYWTNLKKLFSKKDIDKNC